MPTPRDLNFLERLANQDLDINQMTTEWAMKMISMGMLNDNFKVTQEAQDLF